MKLRASFVLILCLLLLPGIITAQDATDPQLVYVRVSVSDRNGRYLTDLEKQHFQVTEDGKPQAITYFSSNGGPVNVAFLLHDTAGAKDSIAAALTGLTAGKRPGDEFAVMEIPDAPLHEVVLRGLNTMLQRGRAMRRALVLITASSDPARYPFSRVKEVLKDQDISLYVIGLILPKERPVLEASGRKFFQDLAEMSGGQSFFPAGVTPLRDISQKIVIGLQNQYVLGYRPTNTASDGTWRNVSVNVAPGNPRTGKTEKLRVAARPGYYAPTVVETIPAAKD